MAGTATQNPLHEPQREKAGAQTFAKYSYQYHWALYRILQEHGESKEYAVFMEYHEDVVLSDSLDHDLAKFEFNQVKTTNKSYTLNDLTKLKQGKSVLGKLLGSCLNKKYSNNIKEINLVAVKGFSLGLKNPEFDNDVIRISDITDTDIKSLEEKIKAELVCDELPSTLRFVIPELSEQGVQRSIIGEIASLIYNLFPSANYKPVDIYRVLYDEITRKGMDKKDYPEWNALLSKKALTSNTVAKVINQFTSFNSESKIKELFDLISTDLGLSFLRKERLKKEFDRYKQNRTGNKL